MDICLLVLNNYTNDARIHKEASTLAAAGHNVFVVALWQKGLARTEQLSGYRVFRLALKSRAWKSKLLSPPIKYLEFAWRVLKLSSGKPAEIYQANDANTLPVAWFVAKKQRAKIIYDARELETGRNFSSKKILRVYRAIWAWPERFFIHSVDAILTTSESYASELKRIYHIQSPTIVMNCPPRISIIRSARLRDQLQIPDDFFICLYQGLISAGRGIEPFFDAIQLLPNVVGVALGDGPMLEPYRKSINMGKWKRVYLPGKVSLEELPYYTASADLGIVLIEDVSRSYHYSSPNKLFEYMHAHIPLIGSNLPEIAEVINTTGIGLVINHLEPGNIAEAINRFITDHEFYNQCKVNTIDASGLYNWENESKKLLDVYQKLQI